LHLAGDALGPRRQVLTADGEVARALQHADRVEIVRRDGDLAVLRSDPPMAGEEARHALPLRHVLGVVPVVELVFRRLPDVHRRDQHALGHIHLPGWGQVLHYDICWIARRDPTMLTPW